MRPKEPKELSSFLRRFPRIASQQKTDWNTRSAFYPLESLGNCDSDPIGTHKVGHTKLRSRKQKFLFSSFPLCYFFVDEGTVESRGCGRETSKSMIVISFSVLRGFFFCQLGSGLSRKLPHKKASLGGTFLGYNKAIKSGTNLWQKPLSWIGEAMPTFWVRGGEFAKKYDGFQMANSAKLRIGNCE